MRKLALSLLPAALLLTGAAPVGSINDMAECRLSYADMRATVASIPVAESQDDGVAPDHKINTLFGGPPPKFYGHRDGLWHHRCARTE